MTHRVHVAIIGSGICGLTAARTLENSGLDILMIDENSHTGGQLLRRLPQSQNSPAWFEPDPMKRKGIRWVNQTFKNCDTLHQAQVLGIFDNNRVQVHGPDEKVTEIHAETILLATGARETYLPFPGWTLPGVMSLGAAQILMKSHGVLPGHHIAIAGTSPLMMVLGYQILKNKGHLTGLFDANGLDKKLKGVSLLPHHGSKLMEGAFYMTYLAAHRVPLYSKRMVIEARGNDRLESVITAKMDQGGRIIQSSRKEHSADTLAMGFGFAPNIELAVQAGCKTVFDPAYGDWIVSSDHQLKTSVDTIYAAGEITGIGGAQKSYIQGRLAGLSILERFKLNPEDGRNQTRRKRIEAQNQKQRAYGSFLNQYCRLPDQAIHRIPDHTLICRCENITMGQIKERINQGFHTTGGIKKASRTGMGCCQGRTCGPIIQDILHTLTRKPMDEIGISKARAPVRNVSVRSFINTTADPQPGNKE